MSVSIRQLGHDFAGEVTGIDCRKPLSLSDVAAIHAGMNDYAVLVFRDQKLSDKEQLKFTLHFGALEETRGGTPGPIHFRTGHEVRKLGPSIKDFSNIDASGKPLATDSQLTCSSSRTNCGTPTVRSTRCRRPIRCCRAAPFPLGAATPNLRTCERLMTA